MTRPGWPPLMGDLMQQAMTVTSAAPQPFAPDWPWQFGNPTLTATGSWHAALAWRRRPRGSVCWKGRPWEGEHDPGGARFRQRAMMGIFSPCRLGFKWFGDLLLLQRSASPSGANVLVGNTNTTSQPWRNTKKHTSFMPCGRQLGPQ
jgi:hypothetical protein